MDFSIGYIWSQIFTVVEYTLLGASYLAKNRKVVVVLDIVSMIAGIVAFLLLGADLGMAMSVIILLANFYYLWEESRKLTKKQQGKERWQRAIVLCLVLVGVAVVTFFTYEGPSSLLSVAATVLYEISIWQKSTKTYKLLGIPVAFCWMTYNGVVRSIAGVMFEGIMLVVSIVGYGRELASQKQMKRRARK